jgi:hypothetical protein
MGRDTGPGGDHRARGFRSIASTLLEEGAFDGPTTRRKTVPTARQGVRRQPGDGDKNKIRGIYNRAAYWSERVRLTRHWSDRLDSLRNGAPAVSPRRSAA